MNGFPLSLYVRKLRRQFGLPGPFWGRQYLFWHEGRPLTLIHEIFSPALQRYLGPINPSTRE